MGLRYSEETSPLDRVRSRRGFSKRHSQAASRRLSRIRCLYQDFTFKAEYAYDTGMPQWLARLDHLLAPLRLERLFLGRHRFYHFRVWYRDELGPYVKDVLLDPRTRQRPYLRGDCLADMVKGHLRGYRNYTTQIHKVLTLELIHRQIIERNWN